MWFNPSELLKSQELQESQLLYDEQNSHTFKKSQKSQKSQPPPPTKNTIKGDLTPNISGTIFEKKMAVYCRDCLNFNCYNKHGGGAGICTARVSNGGYSLWSDTKRQCEKFDPPVMWVYLSEEVNTLVKTVTCYTPAGKAIEIKANSEKHAEFLIRMNPKPKRDKP